MPIDNASATSIRARDDGERSHSAAMTKAGAKINPVTSNETQYPGKMRKHRRTANRPSKGWEVSDRVSK